jgi:hypothetical protein
MHTTKSLKDKKKIISYFHTTKIQKIYVLACILALITSLLKLWELDQYFKNIPKIFCFVLVSVITNLYVKCIPDIKKVDFFIDVRTVRFYLIR